jgi:NADPH-dependent ferric siderophore reductase
MVEVTDDDGRKVELTATEGRRVVWRKISPSYIEAGGSSMDAKTYAVFFIEGERCEVVKLRARLVGPGKPSMMTKAIEFVCSE